jgi:hypothetical protein
VRGQGPPPQVAAVAGNKAGMKQGELGGALKELGYSEDQVRVLSGNNLSQDLLADIQTIGRYLNFRAVNLLLE